jgi:hypothetical protein
MPRVEGRAIFRRLPHRVDGALPQTMLDLAIALARHDPACCPASAHVREFNARNANLVRTINLPGRPGVEGRRMLSVLDESKLRRVPARRLEPTEFLSDYGVHVLSRFHRENPYRFEVNGADYSVTLCLLADWERFIPLSDPSEFSSRFGGESGQERRPGK